MDIEKEKILLAEIKSKPEKFGVLYDEYYDTIFSYIFRRLSDYDLARDIASETFLKAYLKIHAFEWRGISVIFWFYRIATNEINLYFRNNKYVSQSLENAINKNAFDFTDLKIEEQERERIEDELKQHEEFMAILARLKLLKVSYQEVIALKYFEQKSIKEIAIILDKKEGTIKSLLSRGIEKLKNIL